MEQTLKIIGKIHSELKRIADCPLQENENAPEAVVEPFPEFLDGIKDIKPGAEILLLTWLHEADRNVIKCVTRNNYNSPNDRRIFHQVTRSPQSYRRPFRKNYFD